MGQQVLRAVPFAIVLHLAVGAWMLSAGFVFAFNNNTQLGVYGLFPGVYLGGSSVDASGAPASAIVNEPNYYLDAATRLSIQYVTPFPIFIVVWIVVMVLTVFWKDIFRPVVAFLRASVNAACGYCGYRALFDTPMLDLRAASGPDSMRYALKWLPRKVAERVTSTRIPTPLTPSATGISRSNPQNTSGPGCCRWLQRWRVRDGRIGDESSDGKYQLSDLPPFSV
jgi:hypothetical protein